MPLSKAVSDTFHQRQDLLKEIEAAAVKSPELLTLFHDIAAYVKELQIRCGEHDIKLPLNSTKSPLIAPPSKKRKLTDEAWADEDIVSIKEISMSIPIRKKVLLQIGAGQNQGVRALVEDGVIDGDASWRNVHEVACLPVPDKAQVQYNFCVFGTDMAGSAHNLMLWTVPDTVLQPTAISGDTSGSEGQTYRALITNRINSALKPYKKSVTEPSADEFTSQLVQQHRKKDTAYHIKAFRGAKDGYLFLLSTGIIWGFKKPLEWFRFADIDSISYTSVLQRTFNLNIVAQMDPAEESQEYEFSMIDQADFAGIDAYVKKHHLQDASMAETRRAKRVNVNGSKGEQNGDVDSEGEGELAKAAREAGEQGSDGEEHAPAGTGDDDDDEEEEQDENFDPGSEGQSEGEGDSTSQEGSIAGDAEDAAVESDGSL